MKKLLHILPLVLLLAMGPNPPARAQSELPTLELLQFLGDLPLADIRTAMMPEGWFFRGTFAATGETYWTAGETDLSNEEKPAALWLGLRPSGPTLDVLFKSTGAGFGPLHREVLRQKLPVVPVTCLGCEGLRYDAGKYTITFYSHRPAAYPFIVLLHQKAASDTVPTVPTVPLVRDATDAANANP